MIYTMAGISEKITEYNEWLRKIMGSKANNAAFGTFTMLGLFAFGCWLVSYLNKR